MPNWESRRADSNRLPHLIRSEFRHIREGSMSTLLRLSIHEVHDPHSALTLLAVGWPLLRVERIQSSATEAFRTNATANDTTRSVPNRSSIGSAMVMRSAGKKIRRAVAMASPIANA